MVISNEGSVMAASVTALEAKTRFGKLLDRVSRGTVRSSVYRLFRVISTPSDGFAPGSQIKSASLIIRGTKMNSTVRGAAGLTTYLCAACVILSPALAEEYSWQVSADYVDASAGSAASALHRLLRATYHLSPVEDSAGPYELAPFLNRSSYVAVGTTRTTLRDKAYLQSATDPSGGGNDPLTIVPVGVNSSFSAFPLESGFSTSDYAVDGRYVWPASGWFAGARAERGDGDAAPLLSFFRTTSDSRRTGLFAGRYFGPRTAVEVHLESESMTEDVRMNVPGFEPLFGLPNFSDVGGFGGVGTIVHYEFGLVTDMERDNAAVSVRHVGNLAGSTFEFSARLRSTRSRGTVLAAEAAGTGWMERPRGLAGRAARRALPGLRAG